MSNNMKIIDAEKLICPFIKKDGGATNIGHITCQTDKCMAWKTTESETYCLPDSCDGAGCNFKFRSLIHFEETDGFCPECGYENYLRDISLQRDHYRGYCKRLEIDHV